MSLSERDAITAYCRMLNTRDVEPLVPLLAADFVYESQVVLQPLRGVPDFVAYITGKFATLAESNQPAFAELGQVRAYGLRRPCAVLAQPTKADLVGIVLAKVAGDRIARLDVCIVPRPHEAERSGLYPGEDDDAGAGR
ncbi:MAG: nuclear transport factor 2 family protein [Planctomycetes bacterium]|nr:nuclear transport factor 2 family protein [Planctomycetota bacterium]